MRALLVIALLALVGCNNVNRLIDGEKKSDGKAEAHAFYVVSCCRDNNAGVLSYPAFLPVAHVQLCETARAACHGADCQINGDTYLPMSVDCGHGFGHVGDEYYAGRGY